MSVSKTSSLQKTRALNYFWCIHLQKRIIIQLYEMYGRKNNNERTLPKINTICLSVRIFLESEAPGGKTHRREWINLTQRSQFQV